MFTWTYTTPAGDKIEESMSVPELLNPTADQYRRIFQTIHSRYRTYLTGVGLSHEDARWTSYRLSYEALIRCCRRGMEQEFAYVHKCCLNVHRKFLRGAMHRQVKRTPIEQSSVFTAEGSDVELRLDLDQALATLDPQDETICRIRILEGLSFKEIGRDIGLHESSVKRRFDKAMVSLRSILSAYAPPRRPQKGALPSLCVSLVVEPGWQVDQSHPEVAA